MTPSLYIRGMITTISLVTANDHYHFMMFLINRRLKTFVFIIFNLSFYIHVPGKAFSIPVYFLNALILIIV